MALNKGPIGKRNTKTEVDACYLVAKSKSSKSKCYSNIQIRSTIFIRGIFAKAYIQKVGNVIGTKFLEIVKPIYLF